MELWAECWAGQGGGTQLARWRHTWGGHLPARLSQQGTGEQSTQLPLEGKFALPPPHLPHPQGLAVLIRGRKIIAY